MNELAERIALVTGGARGIGRAISTRLAEEGARVVVNYRANEVAAAQTVQAIQQAGGSAVAICADVTDPLQVQAMVDETKQLWGDVSLLVNNAGIFDYGSHTEVTPELWKRTIEVNLTGVYNVTWSIKDSMIRNRFGRIVNISSIAGLRPRPMSIAYSAAKAAVVSFTQSTAEAWASEGVRVNAVAPGLTDTEIIAGVSPKAKQSLIDATPIPRIGSTKEIAEAVLFLLSERSSFTTGQTLVADGGRVMLP
jgi:3-oxoacyl-[acyl-carrier protein] reductase